MAGILEIGIVNHAALLRHCQVLNRERRRIVVQLATIQRHLGERSDAGQRSFSTTHGERRAGVRTGQRTGYLQFGSALRIGSSRQGDIAGHLHFTEITCSSLQDSSGGSPGAGIDDKRTAVHTIALTLAQRGSRHRGINPVGVGIGSTGCQYAVSIGSTGGSRPLQSG